MKCNPKLCRGDAAVLAALPGGPVLGLLPSPKGSSFLSQLHRGAEGCLLRTFPAFSEMTESCGKGHRPLRSILTLSGPLSHASWGARKELYAATQPAGVLRRCWLCLDLCGSRDGRGAGWEA